MDGVLNMILGRLQTHIEGLLNSNKEVIDKINAMLKLNTKGIIQWSKIKLKKPLVFSKAEFIKRPWHLDPKDETIVLEIGTYSKCFTI